MANSPLQIVVAFNFTHSAQAALDQAIELARRSVRYVFHFGCIIDHHTGVPDVPTTGAIDYRYAEIVQQHLTTRIERAFAAADVSTAVHFFVHARFGNPAREILVLAEGVGADLILIGSTALIGLERAQVGSISEAVVRGAGCPVMVARAKAYADVRLLSITEVEPNHHYVPPHRYSYEERRVILRPNDWPLY
jgi:nucleotide-binding universal stress UspA family protein